MATTDTVIEKGLLAALGLAAEKPWSEITLAEIAARAGLTLQDFHGVGAREKRFRHCGQHPQQCFRGCQ